jgi:hypothetical protein
MDRNMPNTWGQTSSEIFSVIGKPVPTNYFLYFLAGMLVGNPQANPPSAPNSFSMKPSRYPWQINK